MVEVSLNVKINSDVQKVWNFINNVSLALSYNKFHRKIDIKKSYRIDSKEETIITHNFGFGSHPMSLEVIDSNPPCSIRFKETAKDKNIKTFEHETQFCIDRDTTFCELTYKVKGTFNNKVADVSFKPILKAVMIDELRKIKLAVESSEDSLDSMKNKQYSPV